MFRIHHTIIPEMISSIENELLEKPLPINKYRNVAGVGRSQCFGIVKQRNGTYTGSRLNFERPTLYAKLLTFANFILPPDFYFDSIQVNQNYLSQPHTDKGNRGESCIIGFGDYSNGELVIEDQEVDIKNKLVFFNGSKSLHYTKPFTGNRFSLVFFSIDKEFKDKPNFSFTTIKNSLHLVEDYKNVRRIFNKKGKILESSDNFIPEIKARQPTLRPCEI